MNLGDNAYATPNFTTPKVMTYFLLHCLPELLILPFQDLLVFPPLICHFFNVNKWEIVQQ